jgi:hypothetical protein
MNNKSPSQAPSQNTTTKKAVLLPLGIVLIFLGLLAARPLFQAAAGMEPGILRSEALILTDILRLGFLGGVICVIIGLLRRRRSGG